MASKNLKQIAGTGGISGAIHKYDGIRLPMHPGLLRCSALKYTWYSRFPHLAFQAPRQSLCVTVFTNSTTKILK